MQATAFPRPLVLPNATAGETFSAGAIVYLDSYNARGGGAARWYKADNAATGPVKIGPIVGVAVTAASSGNLFVVQCGGAAYGFSGLTAGQLVWVGTNGGVVQTQPSLPASGSQVAVALIGFATSASSIFLYDLPLEVSFVKFQSAMGVGATSTVEHWSDAGARTREAFVYLVNTFDPSLVAYYKLDEGAGTSTVDATGNTGPGTLTGSPTWSSSVPGGLGFADPYCLAFNGSSQYVRVPSGSPLNITGLLSLSAWIYPTASGSSTYRTIVSKRDNSYSNYELTLSNASGSGQGAAIFFSNDVGGSNLLLSTYIPPLNTWTYLGASLSGTTLTLYAGSLGSISQVYTGTITRSLSANNGSLGIGTNGDSNTPQYFAGSIDDVRIYNRALSLAEHQAAGGSSLPTYDSPIIPANPIVNSGSTSNVLVRYADGTYQNPATFTTFTNQTGAARDIACEVIL